MKTLTAQFVLDTWEHAQGERPLERSLALLRAAWPEVEMRAWGAMPIGARDASLFALKDALFGPDLDTQVACPACHEALQLRFSTADIRPDSTAPSEDANAARFSLCCDRYEIGYRSPCSDDLIALADAQQDSVTASVTLLLERCVLDVRIDGTPSAVAALPSAVIEQLQKDMARRDPRAEASVAIACPACGNEFERRFDIGDYLWDELDDWAHSTLAEVHLLASAYGWREAHILALSAARRSQYIAMLRA